MRCLKFMIALMAAFCLFLALMSPAFANNISTADVSISDDAAAIILAIQALDHDLVDNLSSGGVPLALINASGLLTLYYSICVDPDDPNPPRSCFKDSFGQSVFEDRSNGNSVFQDFAGHSTNVDYYGDSVFKLNDEKSVFKQYGPGLIDQKSVFKSESGRSVFLDGDDCSVFFDGSCRKSVFYDGSGGVFCDDFNTGNSVFKDEVDGITGSAFVDYLNSGKSWLWLIYDKLCDWFEDQKQFIDNMRQMGIGGYADEDAGAAATLDALGGGTGAQDNVRAGFDSLDSTGDVNLVNGIAGLSHAIFLPFIVVSCFFYIAMFLIGRAKN